MWFESNKEGENRNPGKFLLEGKEYLERGDAVQASEKFYKAAEEALKILSKTHAPDFYEQAKAKGRWTAGLLDKAAEKMGKEIRYRWDSAWKLHVDGFHEMRLDVDSVKQRVEDVEGLVKLAENEEHHTIPRKLQNFRGDPV